MKKTGEGLPRSELTPLGKIQNIKGKQVFEGIASGVNMTTEQTHSQVSCDSDQMVKSSLFSTDNDRPKLARLPNRKRKFPTHYLVQLQICNWQILKDSVREGRREVSCGQKNRVQFREN